MLYLAQAINDAVKDRHGHAWILYKERLEVGGLDDERLDRFDGRHARRPACPAQLCRLTEEVGAGPTRRLCAAEQGHLAEELAWP